MTGDETIEEGEPVKRYTLNTRGRDFVVGDIHGCFSKVEISLEKIGFDYETDRLFCTGDLIDRGPESNQIVDFIQHPWVHSVRGNHEQLLIDIIDNQDMQELEYNIQKNGMGWFEKVKDADEIKNIRKHIGALPFVVEIETKHGLVGIIHAEVPIGMSWGAFTSSIRDRDHSITRSSLWGRTRIMEPNDSSVPGINKIFCGHTVVPGITRLGNMRYVDTGHVFKVLTDKYEGLMDISLLVSGCGQRTGVTTWG